MISIFRMPGWQVTVFRVSGRAAAGVNRPGSTSASRAGRYIRSWCDIWQEIYGLPRERSNPLDVLA